MRHFLLLSSTQAFKRAPSIHAKALVAALLISNGVRRDARFTLYLADEGLAVRVNGDRVRRLFPDEQSAAGFLTKALAGSPLPGVSVRRAELRRLLDGIVADGRPGDCVPMPPFTYVAYVEKVPMEAQCGVGTGHMLPHHQIAVVNVSVDRALAGRRTRPPP